MKHSYEIIEAEIKPVGQSHKELINVGIQVYLHDGDEKEEKQELYYSFSLDTTQEAIEAELDRCMERLDEELEQELDEKKVNEKKEKANETVASLVDKKGGN